MKPEPDSDRPLVEVYFDGECPLCVREINMLKRLDHPRTRIRFTDIAAENFRAEETGKTWQTLMGSIHGRDREGNWIEGVDVFRALYEAVGFRRMVGVSRLPVVRDALRFAYFVFSRYRLRLTGRADACTSERCHPVRAN